MMKNDNIVWQLLRKNVSKGQIVGYAVANFVGFVIVLTAIQFYQDVKAVFSEEEAFFSKDYIVISKRVAFLDAFNGNVSFSEDEIDEIKSQPWTSKVGSFSSANFKVSVSVDFAGRGLSTHLFLEAIPDEFIDVKPSGWHFDPIQKEVPIILSKEYLTLYNFGFASSRGLPQLSESVINKVPLRLYVADNTTGHVDVFDAHIVGFSSRLNTIAVPQEFMTWANDRYAPNVEKSPSRLIIETNSPGDPSILEFMKNNEYEISGDKVDNGKMSHFLTIITIVVSCVGIVISIMAFFILLLSIYLLMQKNKEKIRNLLLLGYSPLQVSRNYFMLIGLVNLIVLILSIMVVLVASHMWSGHFEMLGSVDSSCVLMVMVAFLMMTLITIGNFIAISQGVKKRFYD